MKMRTLALSSLLAVSLAACGTGGGGGGSVNPPINNPQPTPTTNPTAPPTSGPIVTQSVTADSVAMMNVTAAHVTDHADYDESYSPAPGTIGVCQQSGNSSVKFFAPARDGQANSTENIDYYDTACTQIALDVERIVTAKSSSTETVQRTVTSYTTAQQKASTRTQTVHYTNGTFDQYGFTMPGTAVDRWETSTLTTSFKTTNTVNESSEFHSLAPNPDGSINYCGGTAGFNQIQNAGPGLVDGWQGGSLGVSTRKMVSGSLVFTTTRQGNLYNATSTPFSINQGAPNSGCPSGGTIASPMFTLANGTLIGQYTLPLSMTFAPDGTLTNMTVTNGTYGNGEKFNVVTAGSPSDTTFITGTLTDKNGKLIAQFTVDAFGNGKLQTVSGYQNTLFDWQLQ